jgi:hypothetical protein
MITLFKRGILRAALFQPQALALDFEQVGRIAVRKCFAILGHFVGHFAVLGQQGTGQCG